VATPTKQGLRVLGFANFAPTWNNALPFFFYSGLVYEGLIPTRDKDQTGVAFAFGQPSDEWETADDKTYEAVLEFDHRIQLNRWAFLQPFVQYVIRPSGSETIENATVVGMHFGVIF
jgi:carbohydrate-selective porin OprB